MKIPEAKALGIFTLLHYDKAFNPIIEPIRVVRKNKRQKDAGSRKMKMPMITAPAAPMPVHTG